MAPKKKGVDLNADTWAEICGRLAKPGQYTLRHPDNAVLHLQRGNMAEFKRKVLKDGLDSMSMALVMASNGLSPLEPHEKLLVMLLAELSGVNLVEAAKPKSVLLITDPPRGYARDGEHKRYTRHDWSHDAREFATDLGYWEWVNHQLEADAHDRASARSDARIRKHKEKRDV